MDDRDVAKYWDENAPDWIKGVQAGYDVYRDYVNNPAFFGMLPDIAGLRVLDVGCGEGQSTRRAADLGATVVGIDISKEMIEAARRHERDRPRSIEYHTVSGNDMSMFADESFDAAISAMAMMDMADYAGCVREIIRVLKGGGFFQFSILHPCTTTPVRRLLRDKQGRITAIAVSNYFGLQPTLPEQEIEEWFFSSAPPEVKAAARPFRVPRFYRTLGEYFNTLAEAGFVIERLCEPYASEEAAKKCPAVADTRIAPYFLIFRGKKPASD
ncbi:MAG: class I SAM-dependent methyltransferase [Phycisphaerae bacterium]|nr:class I SAM-dependent methyltransferase [Phycisphaerae bacterium]